jgi:hypothetical protein
MNSQKRLGNTKKKWFKKKARKLSNQKVEYETRKYIKLDFLTLYTKSNILYKKVKMRKANMLYFKLKN